MPTASAALPARLSHAPGGTGWPGGADSRLSDRRRVVADQVDVLTARGVVERETFVKSLTGRALG